MKKHVHILTATFLCAGLIQTQAQMAPHGGMGRAAAGPNFSGAMAKIFGDNQSFAADLEMQVGGNQTVSMPGKIFFSDGKSRFEIDMTEMKGHQMPPEATARMKAMGMDKITTISLPQDKDSYLIYPNLKAYVEMPIRNPEATKPESDFKIEKTELGKETLDGHPCVKYKVVVTDDKGQKQESTVWNATDMKDFPIKIESTESGHTMDMVFKDVKLGKQDASLFAPPTDFKKYDNMMELMQQEMMKRAHGGMGMPPQKK